MEEKNEKKQSETKVCKYCQSEIPKKAKICPNCRKKQGGKKWIIIVIVVIVLIAIASSGGGNDSSSVERSTTEKQDTSNTDNIKDEVDKTDSSKDNETIDESLLTPLNVYLTLENNDMIPYTTTEKAKTFLTEHEDLFPAGSDVDDSLIDYSLDYRQILKNETKFGDKLMSVSDAYVVQIKEEEISDGKYFTELNVTDGDQQYYILYIGELNTIFEDSEVSLVGLPLGTSQFDNTDGGQTIVVVLAGVEVKEISTGSDDY